MFRRYPNNLLRLIFLSVALGHGVALQAQRPSVQTPINLKPDIVYKTTAEGDLQMDLYYPASELVGAYPLVVYTHGGGWAAGSKEKAHMIAGVSWYGPCDFEKSELFNPDGRPNFRDRFGSRLLKPETRPSDQLRFYREVSPINYLRKDGPPLLMIQGDKDTTIPVHHAYYMQEKAKACSAPVEILIVKNAGHCWGKVDAPIEPPLNDIVKRTVDFLAAELSRKKALE